MSDIDSFHIKTKLKDGRAVGLNQSKKLIKSGYAEIVYIANDVEFYISEELRHLCALHNVRFDTSHSMASLGTMCNIDVDCAVFAVCKT